MAQRDFLPAYRRVFSRSHPVLSPEHHSQVSEFLKPLQKGDLVTVGTKLGLHYCTLQRMKEPILNELVNAWLRGDDNVRANPSWEDLRKALQDSGHNGIAEAIRKEKGLLTVSQRAGSFELVRFQELDSYPTNSSAESADTSLPLKKHEMMDEHDSNHEAITGEEAEKRLRVCGGHCYLTRYSERRKIYILSVYKQPSTIKHFKICINCNETDKENKIYKLQGKDEEFNSLAAMLSHYENKRIDAALKSIGKAISIDDYCRAADSRASHSSKQEIQILSSWVVVNIASCPGSLQSRGPDNESLMDNGTSKPPKCAIM